MKMRKLPLTIAAMAMLTVPAMAGTVYLDKLYPELDARWSALDSVCRSAPGGSKESNTACEQRLQADKIIEKKGCWNIYPAAGGTSYWKCRK